MTYVMVVNGRAGTAERDTVEAARRELARRADVELVETGSSEDLDAVLAALDARRLVVCGGDGSIHLAVERIRAAGRLDEVAFGVIPLGTGNDLARTLDLPLDPVEAARTVVEGAPRRLDLIEADDGALCVNALHAGIGVDAAARAEALKDRVGEFAYPLGAVAAGATATGWEVTVTVDGEELRPEHDGPVLLVAALNGRSYGGGTPVAPHAEPDDGRMEVLVSTATGPARRAAFGVALRGGRHLDRDDVACRSGTTITIAGEPIGYNVDGELDPHEATTRSFRIRPLAWSVVAPRR